MGKTIPAVLAALLAIGSTTAKKPLDHDSFDSWESVANYALSADGQWAAFAVNPQEGDGTLTLYNTATRQRIVIPRGYRPAFTADGRYAAALVKPVHQAYREARIKGKKDFGLPQDSLAIVDLRKGDVRKVGDVISYRLGKEGGHWIAWQSCDTTLITPKALADKEAGRPLVVKDLDGDARKVVNWVKDYAVSDDGTKVGVTLKKAEGDTLATDAVGLILLPDTSLVILDRDNPYYGAPVFSRDGLAMAYTTSTDTAKSGTLRCDVRLADLTEPGHTPRAVDISKAAGEGLYANQYTVPRFSYDGRRLVTGVAPAIAPDDTTLVDFEKATLDIWRWDAPYTPPQEKTNIEQLRKHTMPVVTDLSTGAGVLVTDNPLAYVSSPASRWDADWTLVADPEPYIVEQQWNYIAPVDLSVKNVATGETRAVATSMLENYFISPAGRYVLWYADRAFHCYDIATGATADVSDAIPYPVWDEDDDHPMPKPFYGVAGWSEDDAELFIYDRFDIWSVDPTGKRAPQCVTAGYGREHNLKLRYRQTDPEEVWLPAASEWLLTVFDCKTKENGLATLAYKGKPATPVMRELGCYSFTQLLKARKAPVFTWQKASFEIQPDIYVSRGYDFRKAARLTATNPQQAEYNWGTAELVSWYAYDGSLAEGVVYKPEDFSPDKEYPMLAVFYETQTENLYRHYAMEPSWSWINYMFYASRGYVIFVPDIRYTPGIPGESAYNYVCSGVEAVCRRYPNIDKKRIGIDGQSWGGYQTAYLVTRTDMFACAGSGAPVANMTSAFGGIRWESGDSRQGQYEQGQSRIGRNLWEAPELYIYNSPVFHADRVTTPLLIMHNDADGAVPWYQGIEMFMALRRLQKPVWMLEYNGEAHNLKERRNRKDITRRLQQFFDHYLKGEPMPAWMKSGIPPLRKGQYYGFEY